MPTTPSRGPAESPRPKRPKTGGRKKGTPNKTTLAIREAMLSVFADLQAEAGRENGHFLDWARGNPTDFYRLSTRLMPPQSSSHDPRPVITRIELVAPTDEDIARSRLRLRGGGDGGGDGGAGRGLFGGIGDGPVDGEEGRP